MKGRWCFLLRCAKGIWIVVFVSCFRLSAKTWNYSKDEGKAVGSKNSCSYAILYYKSELLRFIPIVGHYCVDYCRIRAEMIDVQYGGDLFLR